MYVCSLCMYVMNVTVCALLCRLWFLSFVCVYVMNVRHLRMYPSYVCYVCMRCVCMYVYYVRLYMYLLLCVHTYYFFNKIHTFMCTLFTKKSLHVSANCPLRPTTADHPGSQRAPQSGFSFLDSDTARWQKWIISRACLSGDGVLGTSRFSCSHGTHVCSHMKPVRTWNP